MLISFCWKPGLVVFRMSPYLILTPFFVISTFLMSVSFIPCPLWPDNNHNSVTVLYVNILKLSFFTGERVFKCFNIISGSHVQFVLGFAGLKLNAPFINLVTNRCSPAGLPSIDIILDKLLLAVFNALYPKPLLCEIVRNSKISWTVGL